MATTLQRVGALPPRDGALLALTVEQKRAAALLVHTLMRHLGLSYFRLSEELFRIDQANEEMKKTGQKFLSQPDGPFTLLDRMVDTNGKYKERVTAWAGRRAAAGIHTEITAARAELRALLARETKDLKHTFFSSMSFRNLYNTLRELLPISLGVLHAIAATSSAEPPDPRRRRGVAPVATLSTVLGALGDNDAPVEGVVDGSMGFTPNPIGAVPEVEVEEPKNVDGPLPRKLRMVLVALVVLLYARNKTWNAIQQYFGLFAKAGGVSARVQKWLSSIGLTVHRSTTTRALFYLAFDSVKLFRWIVAMADGRLAKATDNVAIPIKVAEPTGLHRSHLLQLMFGYIRPFCDTPHSAFDLPSFREFKNAVPTNALKPRDFFLDAAGRSSDKAYCRGIFLQILAARCPKIAPAVSACDGFRPPMLRSAARTITPIATLKAFKCSETDKYEYAQLHESHRILMGRTREEMSKWLEVRIGDQLTVKVAEDREHDVKGDDNAFLSAQAQEVKLSGGLHLTFKLLRSILQNHWHSKHSHAVGSLARHAFLLKRKAISIDGVDTNAMFRFARDTHTARVVVLWLTCLSRHPARPAPPAVSAPAASTPLAGLRPRGPPLPSTSAPTSSSSPNSTSPLPPPKSRRSRPLLSFATAADRALAETWITPLVVSEAFEDMWTSFLSPSAISILRTGNQKIYENACIVRDLRHVQQTFLATGRGDLGAILNEMKYTAVIIHGTENSSPYRAETLRLLRLLLHEAPPELKEVLEEMLVVCLSPGNFAPPDQVCEIINWWLKCILAAQGPNATYAYLRDAISMNILHLRDLLHSCARELGGHGFSSSHKSVTDWPSILKLERELIQGEAFDDPDPSDSKFGATPHDTYAIGFATLQESALADFAVKVAKDRVFFQTNYSDLPHAQPEDDVESEDGRLDAGLLIPEPVLSKRATAKAKEAAEEVEEVEEEGGLGLGERMLAALEQGGDEGLAEESEESESGDDGSSSDDSDDG